ncbi:MAG: hypothetical protein NVSMB9_21680 [Isosphaeraceae bacterium]
MSITVECGCGKNLKARNEDAGKRAKCPGCGAFVVIEDVVVLEEVAAPPLPRYQAITLEIGNMRSSGAYVSMSLKIEDNGDAAVLMYVNSDNSRRQGELIRFRPNEFPDYLALVEKVCSTVRNLQDSGRMCRMISEG